MQNSQFTNSEIEQVARACHEVNRAYCREILGDNSHLTWKDSPAWQRDSGIDGVAAVASTPDITPRDSHENWLRVKVAEGWVYGPEKNPGNKTHPCCVEYDKLPPAHRAKDQLFITTALVSLAALADGHEDK